MRTRAGLMQAILLTRECELTLEKNDLPDEFMLKIRGLGRLEKDSWFSKRMVKEWRLRQVEQAKEVRVGKAEAARELAAKKLSDAQVGYLRAIWDKKGNPVAFKQGERLCERHLLSMKPAICSDWKASVIAGNGGNGFTADVLKAHLTIIKARLT